MIEKAKVGDAIYDVITIEEYYRAPQSYGKYTAIRGEDGYIYPIRSKSDNRPGFYPTGGLDFFKPPTCTNEYAMYSQQNVINFSEASSIRDIIKAQQKLADDERTILTTVDNVFVPEITDSDTPEMKAVKEAIIAKHIDIDKYEKRFGPNFNNDKRLLRKNSITFGKMRSIFEALDMKASLTIEDKDPTVPNPIGKAIVAQVTGPDTIIDSETE